MLDPMTGMRPSVRQATNGMLASAVVSEVAQRLHSNGVDVMPVKGALLQQWLYDDPADRPLTDVDVVVRPSQFATAKALLESAGYPCIGGNNWFAATFQTPWGLPLDLHGGLFDKARYRFRTDAIFTRARLDHALFDAPVWVPAPLDIYAQLLGKCASDHVTREDRARLAELSRVAEVGSLEPHDTARHLCEVGMRRATRYVLGIAVSNEDDPFAAAVLNALPADPVGSLIARASRAIVEATPPASLAGAVAAHLLNDSIARGLWSGGRAMMSGSSWRFRPR